MKSMTGYGRGSADGENFSVSVDLKAVNNRFLDVHLRLSSELASLEPVIKRQISSRLARGRVDVTVNFEKTSQTAYELNRPLIAGYVYDQTGNYRVGFDILAAIAAAGSIFFILAKKPPPPARTRQLPAASLEAATQPA